MPTDSADGAPPRSDDSPGRRSAAAAAEAEASPPPSPSPSELILHHLIRQRRFSDAIRLIDSDPTKVRTVDPRTGDVPLLAALRIPTTPLGLVEALLDAYPYEEVTRDMKLYGSAEGTSDGGIAPRRRTAEGSPLFVAVKHGLGVDVVRKLISVSGIDRLRDDINREKQLPLHVAPIDNAPLVETLINATSHATTPSRGAGAASSADMNGLLPLHCFVRKGQQPTLASVEVLLSAFPDALRRRDNAGKLPLHYAMEHNASVVLIQAFVASYPDSARVPDADGNYPVHCAFLEGSRTFNLRRKLPILLSVFPEAASIRNHDGLTPLGMAERCRLRNAVNSLDFNIEGPVRELLGRAAESWYAGRRSRKRARVGGGVVAATGAAAGASPDSSLLDGETRSGGKDDRARTDPCLPPPAAAAAPHHHHRQQQQCASCREHHSSPHALVPCGHVALCGECAEADQLVELDGCCPIKKCRFFRAQKVFGRAMGPRTITMKPTTTMNTSTPSVTASGRKAQSSSADTNNEDEERCVICLEGSRSHLLVPCGHVILCGGCANDDGVTERLRAMACPLARCRVRGVMKIEWQGGG